MHLHDFKMKAVYSSLAWMHLEYWKRCLKRTTKSTKEFGAHLYEKSCLSVFSLELDLKALEKNQCGGGGQERSL